MTTLLYDEPWGWMQPTRHALGALLLEQGHVEEAEAVYRADLGLDDTLRRPCQHPDNVWSLHGYHECLHRLGRRDEADSLRPQLDAAMAEASVPIAARAFAAAPADRRSPHATPAAMRTAGPATGAPHPVTTRPGIATAN